MTSRSSGILETVGNRSTPSAEDCFAARERFSAIFSPENPADSAPAEPEQTPERRLMAAVLEQALSIVRGEQSGFAAVLHPRVKAEAVGWFASRDVSWPMSFESVCAVLGIDADAVRGKVAEWVVSGAPKRRDHRRPVGNGQVRIVPRRA